MDLFAALIEILAPRTVMVVGGFVAFATAIPLAIQSLSASRDRVALIMAALAMLCAAASLVINAPLIRGTPAELTWVATMLGTISYLGGIACLLQLFRSNYPRSIVIVCAAVCLLGYAIWPEGHALSRWANICQMLIGLVAVSMVLHASDPLAPRQRWLTFGVCLFIAVGALPRITAMLFGPGQSGPAVQPHVLTFDTPALRIEALLWAITPILAYASLIGVIQTRVARRLRDSVDHDMLTGARSRHFLFEAGHQMVAERRADHVTRRTPC